MLTFILGLFIGSVIGMFTWGLMAAASLNDREHDYHEKEEKNDDWERVSESCNENK